MSPFRDQKDASVAMALQLQQQGANISPRFVEPI
jgi:hypothetical protein